MYVKHIFFYLKCIEYVEYVHPIFILENNRKVFLHGKI